MEYTYEQMFQRNIGIFTPEEQEKIANFTVAIAGAGGLGGELAHLLVRLGVMNIKLCDPEVFEVSNINRQFACYVDTIGMNKAQAVAKELIRINPSVNLEVWDYGIDAKNAARFVEGSDVVIDAIEFFSIAHSIELQEAARQQNKWVMTAQIVGSMVSTMYIKPGGPHFGDLFFVDGEISILNVVNILFPVLPKEATPEWVDKVVNHGIRALPSWSHGMWVPIILLEDLVVFFIKGETELLAAPAVTLLDLCNKEFIVSGV